MILRLVVGTNVKPKSSMSFYTVLLEGQLWCRQFCFFRNGAVEYSMQVGAPFLHPFWHGSGSVKTTTGMNLLWKQVTSNASSVHFRLHIVLCSVRVVTGYIVR